MMCYKDKTWCPYVECSNFGDSCHRSLTEDVMEAAEKWWNPTGEQAQGHAPICMYAGKPECFEEKHD